MQYNQKNHWIGTGSLHKKGVSLLSEEQLTVQLPVDMAEMQAKAEQLSDGNRAEAQEMIEQMIQKKKEYE